MNPVAPVTRWEGEAAMRVGHDQASPGRSGKANLAKLPDNFQPSAR